MSADLTSGVRARHRAAPVGALLILAMASAACHARSATPDAATDGKNDTANDAAGNTAPTGALAVRLERGPCFGRCMEYVVELFDDGAVRFDGRRNVKVPGETRSTIAASAVRALQQAFADAGFASADSAYVEGTSGCGRYLPDGPRTVLGARLGTTMKTVQHDAGCTAAPKFLQSLAARVDSVARTRALVDGPGDNNR